MKKLIYAFCAIALCLAFTSCEKNKEKCWEVKLECSFYSDYYEDFREIDLETYVWCSEVDIEKEVEDIIDDVEKKFKSNYDISQVKIKEEWKESRYDNADDCEDEADDAEEEWKNVVGFILMSLMIMKKY